jgi:orotate phosphoribosyltransferase
VSDRDELLQLIKDIAVMHGKVTLSSGREADYYIDLRRITLHHKAAPLVGRVLREVTADWSYDAAGGLTLGADPVVTAIMHAAASDPDSASDGGRAVDSFVVRKAEKKHGMQQRVEGPSVAGRRVLVVEDVSTTGSSPLTAVEALREAGAEVVGVAVIVDRGARAAIEAAGLQYRSAYTLADLGLS